MSLLFMDSFDHYATADAAEKYSVFTSNGATVAISANGRNSSSSFRGVPGGGSGATTTFYAQKTIAASGVTAILGFAFRFSALYTLGAGSQIASIRDGASPQITIRLNTNNTLSVLRGGAAGTVLGTTVAALTTNSYSYIELKVLVDNTVGTVDLRVNNVSLSPFPLTSQDTQVGSVAQWTGFSVGLNDTVATTLNGVGANIDFDDVYVCDGTGSAPWNDFLGDCRVDSLYPTAEGTTIQWTPLSGSDNALMVDETVPDDDTTYNSAASTSLTDTLVVQDAPVVGATIYGIQHNLSMKKSDAGVCTVAPVIRHSGVDNVGASLSPGTTYAYGLQIAQVNPGTSAAWVEADFNAAEFGYKRLT